MGQRTAFLIKRTYWNGKVNIRLVHHQWGIGRVMHNHFIRDFMEMVTNRTYPPKTMLGDRKGEEYITPAHQEITFKMNKSAKQL